MINIPKTKSNDEDRFEKILDFVEKNKIIHYLTINKNESKKCSSV